MYNYKYGTSLQQNRKLNIYLADFKKINLNKISQTCYTNYYEKCSNI